MKVGTQLELMKIPVKDFVPEVLSAAPASPVNGQIYYNSTTNKLQGREGGAWVDLSLDTVYSVPSGAEVDTGTATTPRVWTAALVKQGVITHAPVKSVAGKVGVVTLATADVIGLDTALAGKAASSHTHTIAQVTGLDTALAGKAPTTHNHTAAQITSGTFTPALLPAATEAAQGAVELATTAEVTTGTDSTRAVTAAGVKAAIDAKVYDASVITTGTMAHERLPYGSETQLGVVELATAAEAAGGVDTSRVITPATLKPIVDGKAASSHTHTTAQVTGLDTALAGKAASSHTHVTSHVTGLDAALASKVAKTFAINVNEGLTGGGAFNGVDLTLAVDTTVIATRAYAESLAQGLRISGSVKHATTGNITLSGTQTIDNAPAAVGERVLVKNQTDAKQNGIYLVATGAWTRTDLTADDGTFWFVQGGATNSTNRDTGWVLTTGTGPGWGVVDHIFEQFSGAGQITAGNGLSKIGDTLNVVAGTGLVADANSVRLSSTYQIPLSQGGTGETTVRGLREKLGVVKYGGVVLPALSPGVWSAAILTPIPNASGEYRFTSPPTITDGTGQVILLDVKADSASKGWMVRADVAFASGTLNATGYYTVDPIDPFA